MERELKRIKSGRLYLIPASEDTRGRGTTGMEKFSNLQVRDLLQTRPGGQCRKRDTWMSADMAAVKPHVRLRSDRRDISF
jgi:hypothetical protein